MPKRAQILAVALTHTKIDAPDKQTDRQTDRQAGRHTHAAHAERAHTSQGT